MPASVLIVTPGDAAANAYVSLAAAAQYDSDRLTDRYDTVWAGASDAIRTQAILRATKLLDRLVPWTGTRVNDTQALKWPRYGMYDLRGVSIPSTAIPSELQEATAEYARHLLFDVTVLPSDAERAQVEKLARLARNEGLGTIQIHDATVSMRESPPSAKPIPDSVYYLLPGGWVYASRSVAELLRA